MTKCGGDLELLMLTTITAFPAQFLEEVEEMGTVENESSVDG
jgi:hypothetical protein